MLSIFRRSGTAFFAFPMLAFMGCGDTTGPEGTVVFVDESINLGLTSAGSFQVRNENSSDLGPVSFRSGEVFERGGNEEIGGADLRIFGGRLEVLESGKKLGFSFVIDPRGLPPGPYSMNVYSLVDGQVSDKLVVHWGFGRTAVTQAETVNILPPDLSNVRQGVPAKFDVQAFAFNGTPVQTQETAWYVLPTWSGTITSEGLFVADSTGSMRVVATIGTTRDEVSFSVLPAN
jgi:hypothetical protein